jgi:hypothetical protein
MLSSKYFIWSIEHGAWWRPNWCGYTPTVKLAGLYSRAEGDEILARANRIDVNECLVPEAAVDVTELRVALAESVKLQSHYASLLNMYDGGRRIGFEDADAWIARLREMGTLPSVVL